jgi:Zn-dependent protease
MIFSLLTESPGIAAAFIISIIVGITIHEFAHALAGYLQGDMTARDSGRLTLNPLAHLDPLGSLMLLFAGFGWGKPTPYNPHQLRNARVGSALIALAGPISNCIGAIVSIGLIFLLAPYYSSDNLLIVFLVYLFFINIMLMIFNLIPIPPLDGSQILFSLLPSRYDTFKYFLAQNGPMILFGLILIDNFSSVSIFGAIYEFFFSFIGKFLP